MRPMNTSRAALTGSLKYVMPMAAIIAVPTPDQIAYDTLTGMY